MWCKSHRADQAARVLADRHYNRQKIGAPQFVPPGRCCVLLHKDATAFWVTSYPFAEYVKHQWAGAWICSAFRNESSDKASVLIRQAVAATRAHFGDPPELGMVTFIDMKKVRPVKVRGDEKFGRTYVLAGFRVCGVTKGGLLAFQLRPEDMPEACDALPPRP